MAQHSKRRDAPGGRATSLGAGQPLLEAQVVDAADSLAYDTHDVDDALERRPDHARRPATSVRVLAAGRRARRASGTPRLGPEQFQPTVVRALIDWQVTDLLEHTRATAAAASASAPSRTCAAPRSPGRARAGGAALKAELEAFLHRRVYRHYRVHAHGRARAGASCRRCSPSSAAAPELLPDRYCRRVGRRTGRSGSSATTWPA